LKSKGAIVKFLMQDRPDKMFSFSDLDTCSLLSQPHHGRMRGGERAIVGRGMLGARRGTAWLGRLEQRCASIHGEWAQGLSARVSAPSFA